MSEMHSAAFGWTPGGLIAQGGLGVIANADWGQFPELRYIWGIQGDLYASLAIPPGNCIDAIPSSQGGGPGASYKHYLQSIADMGVTVYKPSTGEILLQKGCDHYDNEPGLNDNPHFFPHPFYLNPGDSLHMTAHAENGYQKQYGGGFGFNANVIVFYTLSL
jgi:hypothetical protein